MRPARTRPACGRFVKVDGSVRDLDARLEHHSYTSWAECQRKLLLYARAGTEGARRKGRRAGWVDVVVRPPLRFVRMYVFQLGFLDGAHGAVVCAMSAAQVFLKYAGLWAAGSGANSGEHDGP